MALYERVLSGMSVPVRTLPMKDYQGESMPVVYFTITRKFDKFNVSYYEIVMKGRRRAAYKPILSEAECRQWCELLEEDV